MSDTERYIEAMKELERLRALLDGERVTLGMIDGKDPGDPEWYETCDGSRSCDHAQHCDVIIPAQKEGGK